MPADTTGAAEPQTGTATQPQAGAGPSSQTEGAQKPQAGGAAAEGGTDAASIARERDEAREAAKAANAEAAKTRLELKRFTDAQKAADDAKLSDAERQARESADLKAENAALKAENRETRTKAAVFAAATRLGFRDPDLAFPLVDASLEYAEDGKATNIAALLGDVLKKSPYLGKGASTDFGGGNRGGSPAGTTDMNAFLRKAAGR